MVDCVRPLSFAFVVVPAFYYVINSGIVVELLLDERWEWKRSLLDGVTHSARRAFRGASGEVSFFRFLENPNLAGRTLWE